MTRCKTTGQCNTKGTFEFSSRQIKKIQLHCLERFFKFVVFKFKQPVFLLESSFLE